MSATWQKSIRDSWRERTRTVLVVLAIALGVAAFQAVMSAYAILTQPSRDCTGNAFLCEDVLRDQGVEDLSVYNAAGADAELQVDLFVDHV